MQDELVRGSTPAAAPGAVTRDVRLCLACLHENRSGEQACEVCGTSLYLILCGACEAVNDPGALRCYGCGAALGSAAGDRPAPAGDKPAPADDKPAPFAAGRMSLVRAEANDSQAAMVPTGRMNRGRLALILAAVAVTTVGLAYYYFPRASRPPVIPVKSEVTAVKPEAAAVKPEVTPAKPVEPARVTPPRTEPKAHARVTHTQPADASQTAPSAPVRAAPVRAAPVARTAPVAPAAPDAGQKSQAGCSEAVAALGLCTISAKSGAQ